MSMPRQSKRFAEAEFCLQNYFNTHFVPIMNNTRSELQGKQVEEAKKYNRSANGILRSWANAANNMPDDTMQHLRLTGEQNGKTAEDYVEMCKQKILANKDIQKDLVRLAGEWRKTVVAEIGRERYEQISSRLGTDLALAYTDYRVEQMMIDKMVAEQMPKSSFDYILRKGAGGSLFGLAQELQDSPLQREIDRRGEAAYHPKRAEKAAGKATSFGMDIVTTGGFSSWAAVAKLGVMEIGFAGLEHVMGKNGRKQTVTVEECISRAVFGGTRNHFEMFRKEGRKIKPYENKHVLAVNDSLTNKLGIPVSKPFFEAAATAQNSPKHWQTFKNFDQSKNSMTNKRNPKYANVPLIVAPGKEDEFLAEKEQREARQRAATQEAEPKKEMSGQHEKETDGEDRNGKDMQETSGQEETGQATNENGWENLLSAFGLDGLGAVGQNFGYVVSMLPDLLVGLFTGKTKSIRIQDNLLPLASILMGMYVKNPILKMALVGMGGLNLLNKAGHEAIDRKESTSRQPEPQFKSYADEPLNPRIDNPVIQGNVLVATIDRVPCSIRLPENAVAAYRHGSLPINTLANAVLARNDEMQQMARDNYRTAETGQENAREMQVGIK